MFPSPYLSQLLDEAHQADLLAQMIGRPSTERQFVQGGRAALARLIRRHTASH